MRANNSFDAPISNGTGGDFLVSLKQKTRDRHQALEETLLSRALMSPGLTRNQYVSVLYGFYRAFHPLEQALASISAPIQLSERTYLAAGDIRYLTGAFDLSGQLQRIPLHWLRMDMPVALGIAYVLEGSRLGGKVISRHIEQTLGITPETGGAFFAGNDSPGLEGWRSFKRHCASYAEQHPPQQEKIIQAANEAFAYVEESFTAFYSSAVT